MNERTKQGLNILEAALLLGLLGDALLRATPWGLNLLLWTGALVLAAFLALPVRWRRERLSREVCWLVLPVIFFAAALAWRDSLVLNVLAVISLLVALALAAMSARGARIRVGGVMGYAAGMMLAGIDALFGFFPLVLRDVKWKELPSSRWSKNLMAVIRGLLIAAPLLFVFGLLLMAADAVFEGLVNRAFYLNPDVLLGHIFLACLFAWLGGGFLRGMLLGRELTPGGGFHFPFASQKICSISEEAKKSEDEAAPQRATRLLSLGIVELGVVLGLLDALFLSFVLVQIRYFFGGASLVQATTGLTYAEYARRGFFELVWVAALALPLLLAAHWLLRKENPLHERIFRALAGVNLVLLFVIMSSAVGRMRLYQAEYGLTELRLYTTAFMGWLALVFVWFALTVLRGQRERFACGALTAAFLVIATLHFLNPDALIVRVNLEQARAGHSFDAGYAASLSADSVPELVRMLPLITQDERCLIASRALDKWSSQGRADWRTWNWSRSRARRSISERAEMMRELQCPVTETTVAAPSSEGGPTPIQPTAEPLVRMDEGSGVRPGSSPNR